MDKETLQKQIEKRQNKTITLGFAADSGDSAPAAQPAEKPAPVPPKPVAKPTPAEPPAPSPDKKPSEPAASEAGKSETPQEAVKRHLQNNQGKTP